MPDTFGLKTFCHAENELYKKTRHLMTFLQYVDDALFSYQCKMIKPDREIYAYACGWELSSSEWSICSLISSALLLALLLAALAARTIMELPVMR